jgi:hypothetical protein
MPAEKDYRVTSACCAASPPSWGLSRAPMLRINIPRPRSRLDRATVPPGNGPRRLRSHREPRSGKTPERYAAPAISRGATGSQFLHTAPLSTLGKVDPCVTRHWPPLRKSMLASIATT